jgi:hypothetical protein
MRHPDSSLPRDPHILAACGKRQPKRMIREQKNTGFCEPEKDAGGLWWRAFPA